MIVPTKYLNLDLCVLRTGAVILKTLRRVRVLELDELRQKVIAVIGADAELLFMPAANFLFLLGRLDYHPENDTFEYLEPHETSTTGDVS